MTINIPLNWQTFLDGAIHSALSGAAGSLSGFIADPAAFNLGSFAGAKKLGVMALSGAIIGLAGYVRQSPLSSVAVAPPIPVTPSVGSPMPLPSVPAAPPASEPGQRQQYKPS